MVLEISSVTDIFFCHLGLFFALLPPRAPYNLENQNPGDIIILHMKNEDQN